MYAYLINTTVISKYILYISTKREIWILLKTVKWRLFIITTRSYLWLYCTCNIVTFLPYFSEVHCGPAIEIKNTNYSTYGDDKLNGKVIYTCNRGYQQRSGEGFSRCQLNGTWTKPTLICEGDFFIFVREQWYLENSHNIIFTPKYRCSDD